MSLIDPQSRDFDALCANFQWRIPSQFNIGVDVCDKHVARGDGDNVALYLEGNAGQTRQVSFAELKQLSDRFANALTGLGIRPGDRVALILPQCLEAAVCHLAVYKIGAIALPLAKLFGPDAVPYRLANSGSRLVVTDNSHMDMMRDIVSDLPALERLLNIDQDAGIKDEDGYLWFKGRKDDVISSAGHRIGPGEVEDSLLKHPAVANAAVIGAPDALRGQIVKAFIVLASGYMGSQALVQDIQDSVKSRLAAYEYPRAIEFIDELPMTTTGKVRRLDLRARPGAGTGHQAEQ
jgi:acyl-coenzyme A synthetase/AMP-(fatty) acid ligase